MGKVAYNSAENLVSILMGFTMDYSIECVSMVSQCTV